MKLMIVLTFFLLSAIVVSAQNNEQIPANLPPGYLEMLKKSMPPGVQLPPELMKMIQQAEAQQKNTGSSLYMPQPLIPMQPVKKMSYPSDPAARFDYSPFGSGRDEAARKAAVMSIEYELNSKPLVLPLPETTPTKEYLLDMAAEQHKLARQKFRPDDLTEYARLVTWVPRFDGSNVNKDMAGKYSMAVALTTNNNPHPYFNIALACATYSLDPENSVQANNLASAIISGGELVTEKNPTTESLAPYRRDAESAFLFAISHSLKEGEWSEATLIPAINLGNLCIDLKRWEEARSLFMVARKIKPESWDAALGLAAYFMALNQKDKALAIMEDDRLDRPETYGIPIKHNKSLEKSEPFSDLPPESPEEKYEEGINIMTQEPVLTSADFIAQLDQSERNKMRYFIENLPVKGSFVAPSIKKLTQYSTLKAISSPQGVSALLEFTQMIGIYTLGRFASTTNQQLDWLSKFGLKIDPGVDLDDVAKHPEKYLDNNKVKPKVTGKEEFMANMQEMKKEAMKAKMDLASGKTESLTKLASKVDNVHGILLINPGDYADPMNVITQKMNYTVYQRKNHLYQGYLYALTKKTYRQVSEIIEQCTRKIGDLSKLQESEMEQYETERKAAEKQAIDGGYDFPAAEWDMRRHNIHVKFFNAFNNIEETGFGSATNVISVAYIQRIKPAAENYYYDVFRHVAMISDPEVRDQKNADLKNSIYSALVMALQTVQMAHGSFSYSDDWDCNCNLEELLAAREAEQKAMEEEENALIERNKAAKAVFDSGEIPESSPLFKKLDAYVDEYNFGLVKVRASCARTTLEANTDFLPNNLPFKFKYSSSESEFTGAITRNAGVSVGVEKDMGNAKVNANLNLDVSVSSDGNGNVKSYSVTGGADAGVKVGNYSVSAGVGGKVSNNNGVTDYSVSGNAQASVKYGSTTVSGGASADYSMSKGLETDFSAGVKQDWKNDIGTSASMKMEVSTKRGCSFSHKVEQTLTPVKKAVEGANKAIEDSGLEIPSDFLTKELWSGKYVSNK